MAEKTHQEAQVPAKNQSVPTTREDTRYLTPAVDIYETEDAIVVVADMPGVEKEDLEVRVADGILTLEGHAKHAFKGTSIYSEFGLMNFYRQFQLSEEIDQEKIEAELKYGTLTVRLPKAEQAKPKKISIKVS